MPPPPEAAPSAQGFRLLGEELRYQGWRIRVVEARVSAPDGTVFTRDVVRHPGAVAVVAVTEDRHAVLVRQYRAALGSELLEIPAGTRDVPAEPPEETARRELAEEAGLRAGRLARLGTMANSPGFCDEETILFLATELEATPPARHGEEERFLEVVEVPLDDLDVLVADGVLLDAQTILGLMLARQAAAH